MPEPRLLHPEITIKQESAKAKAAFHNYCRLGPARSLEKLIVWYQKHTKEYPNEEQYVPNITALKRWSREQGWQVKVVAYDEEQEAAQQQRRTEALEKMDEEQATWSRLLLLRSVDALRKRLEADNIGAYALVQLFEKSANLERIARGAATERSEQSGELSVSGQVGFYPVQLPQKDEGSLPAKVALPRKGGDA